MRLITLFILLTTFNVYAWEDDHKVFLSNCDKKSFDKFHKSYSVKIKEFKRRSIIDNMIINLFFSTYLSPSDPSYNLYNDCGVYFSKYYNSILEKEEADFELINKWENCFEISFNGQIPSEHIKNIKCTKDAFMPQ